MPLQARRHPSRADADFIGKILSVLQNFRFKGKPYLPYLQARERNDEFLMRDNIVKPLFVALGYHSQQDFSPEEIIATAPADTEHHRERESGTRFSPAGSDHAVA